LIIHDAKGKKILFKDELCSVIKKKMREIKTKAVITDADRLAAYTKDINKCDQGDTKGGYNILQLREIVINYFGIDEKKADNMKKKEICPMVLM